MLAADDADEEASFTSKGALEEADSWDDSSGASTTVSLSSPSSPTAAAALAAVGESSLLLLVVVAAVSVAGEVLFGLLLLVVTANCWSNPDSVSMAIEGISDDDVSIGTASLVAEPIRMSDTSVALTLAPLSGAPP